MVNQSLLWGTLFYDNASIKICVHHQVSLSGLEMLDSKHSVEHEYLVDGVHVKKCHSDNGVFSSFGFEAALEHDGQIITKYSVSTKHQNTILLNMQSVRSRIWLVSCFFMYAFIG